jgi:hypothetical protein
MEPAFRADQETERRLREGLLPALDTLLEELPSHPPKGVDENVYAVAHGLYCRIARTCQATLLLVDAGLGSEAAPLRRSALEHALTLAWVVDEGRPATDVLLRAHQARMRSVKQKLDDRWSVKPEDFEKLLSVEVPSAGRDHLVSFGNLAKQFDASNDLLAAWLADTGESHPSHMTASAYWHSDSSGQMSLSTTVRERAANDVHVLSFVWWLGTGEMEPLAGWSDERLRQIGSVGGLPVTRLPRVEGREDPDAAEKK